MEFSKVQQVVSHWSATVFVTLLLVGCDVVTSGGPLDRASALQQSQSDLPLPPSAHDIYYLHVDQGTQQHYLFVRFSGDLKDIADFAEAKYEKQNEFLKGLGRPIVEPVLDTGKQAMARKPWGNYRKLPNWWHPENIQKGRYIGSGAKAIDDQHFWIDEEKGEAFFYGHY